MIANMNETSMWADMPSATTVDGRGIRTVPIRSTGHEKNRLTVRLAVKADGTKMKLYAVITTKKVTKRADIDSWGSPGSREAAWPNSWMNESFTSNWIKKCGRNFFSRNACLCGTRLNAIFLIKGRVNYSDITRLCRSFLVAAQNTCNRLMLVSTNHLNHSFANFVIPGFARVNLILLRGEESNHQVIYSKSSGLFRDGKKFQNMLRKSRLTFAVLQLIMSKNFLHTKRTF